MKPRVPCLPWQQSRQGQNRDHFAKFMPEYDSTTLDSLIVTLPSPCTSCTGAPVLTDEHFGTAQSEGHSSVCFPCLLENIPFCSPNPVLMALLLSVMFPHSLTLLPTPFVTDCHQNCVCDLYELPMGHLHEQDLFHLHINETSDGDIKYSCIQDVLFSCLLQMMVLLSQMCSSPEVVNVIRQRNNQPRQF